ncbi:antitoxin [Zavarzinia compransoris]|uniref:antitoxin n=1 Tax=Zavarzinia marina TaxID=2911065 RepID=UPI001F37D85C|nr:antitoxin [Zavarzinia marina]MCF4166395.1 antitoxin [Zavarzinia marina]
MPRLSIDLTTQEHQRLKAVAALNGQTIKEFVLSRTLKDVPDVAAMSEDEAMQTLADFLKSRVEQVKAGETVGIPPGDLLKHVKARAKG